MQVFALVDGNSFFASCEKVFGKNGFVDGV